MLFRAFFREKNGRKGVQPIQFFKGIRSLDKCDKFIEGRETPFFYNKNQIHIISSSLYFKVCKKSGKKQHKQYALNRSYIKDCR